MAHPMNDILNRIEGRKTVPCNNQCKYWKFPHLETACVLSDVFSVKKDHPCFEFDRKVREMNKDGDGKNMQIYGVRSLFPSET